MSRRTRIDRTRGSKAGPRGGSPSVTATARARERQATTRAQDRPAAGVSPAAPPAWTRPPAWVAVPLALVVVLWACRGAPLGTPVADDFSFLYRLAFQRPLDAFDSMGASYYWRPLSRQLYFSLVGPWAFEATWGVAALHAALLFVLGVVVYRIARRDATPAVAAAIAACVALAEPARTLLGWPSGAQHLLAGLAAALAVHEAIAGRLATSTLAAVAGVLSHESAALALPVVPLVVWRERRDRRATLRATAAVLAVAAVWAAGYHVALAHGVLLPPGGGPGALLARLPTLYSRALRAAFNAEDAGPDGTALAITALALLALAAIVIWLVSPPARRRLRAILPLVLVAAGWFVAGVLPLAALLPDWNAWRAWTPTIGVAVAAGAVLGAASPWLAGGLVAVKLLGLLVAPTAPRVVSAAPPQDGSHVSFRQLVRLQRVVSATRTEMLARVPGLPLHARVCYWELPLLSEFAFQGSRALRVWYRDSSLVWTHFGGQLGLKQHADAAIEYRYGDPVFAAVIPGAAVTAFQTGADLMAQHRFRELDATLREAERLAGYDRGPFFASLIRNLAFSAYDQGNYAAADSLRRVAEERGPESPDNWLLRSLLALARNDRRAADLALRRTLAMDPSNRTALELAHQFGLGP